MINWEPWKYHPVQRKFWESRARFICMPCGRKSGKTRIAMRKLITRIPIRRPWRDPQFFYAAPTYKQARLIAWEPFIDMIPPLWIKKVNESRLEIKFVTGATLRLIGLDKSYRHEGPGYDGGIMDECSDIKPETFNLSFLPAMSHRQGWCIFIGIPKRFGVGGAEFKKRFYDYKECTDGSCASFTWTSDSIVPPEEIELARRSLTEKDFNEQYHATWESIQGGVFYAFNHRHNVEHTGYVDGLPIIVGVDFNVDPMAWVISQYHPDGTLHVIDELFIRNTNTLDALNYLYQRLDHRVNDHRIIFIGDATGRARKTSSTVSDWIIIQNDDRFNKMLVVPKRNPLVQDRFACTNAALCSADEITRVKIDPRCENLIRDLETRSYKDGTREPDDSGDIGHMTDALGYVIWNVIPMQVNKQQVAKTINSIGYKEVIQSKPKQSKPKRIGR